MPLEISILVCAICFFLISPCLIILNKIRKNAEQERILLDYIDYVKNKAKGDEVDQLIAKYLGIEDLAAS
tara:strand:+ start:1394 stop:1603 length:210 start_codon:yes stop_codon:yes gene_type:complete